MKISLTSVYVDDQAKALEFYTEKLGFEKKFDIPAGGARWLTVTAPGDPGGTQLLLEPAGHPASKVFKEALVADGIPFAMFETDDIQAEYQRLQSLGVEFTQPPMEVGDTTMAVFDDTCGNLIAVHQPRIK